MRVDAQQAVDGGSDVVGREGPGDGVGPDVVRLANHLPGQHPGSGEHGKETGTPVVPPLVLVDLGSASELAEHHHERLVQASRIMQVIQQCGDTTVHRRQQAVLERGKNVAVVVPGLHPADVALNHRHTHLQQPTSQEQRLPGGVATVTVSRLVVLAVQFECAGQ